VTSCYGLCLSYKHPPVACSIYPVEVKRIDPVSPQPEPLAWCGCVEGRCTFFTQ
jgi:hypothetical protein